MTAFATPAQWFLGCLLILSSLGVILAPKPVQSSLYFLLSLLTLAALYLQLSAQFIAVMQVLVYAGAILVLFMFVIILFQDAHVQIAKLKEKSSSFLLAMAGLLFTLLMVLVGGRLLDLPHAKNGVSEGFGSVESLGHSLYIDFFFPFEAVILIFLVAIVGALYIGKKEA
jgi:NADH-quinone oxidoreductase subunit J